MNTAQRQNLSQVFREEALEQLDQLNQSILQLEQAPPTAELLESILRTAHSLKGGAKLVGAASIEKVTHSFESMMVEIREGRLTVFREAIDTVLDSIDCIRNELGGIEHQPGRDPDTIAGKLLNLAARGAETPDFGATFPKISEGTSEFLTESQKSSLLVGRKNGNKVYSVLWTVNLATFLAEFDNAVKLFAEAGNVVGFVPRGGTSQLTFEVLYLVPGVKSLGPDSFAPFTVAVTDVLEKEANPATASQDAEARPDLRVVPDAENEFNREMALLLEQYIAEHLDEFDEFSKDILRLDKEPHNHELVHGLFRRAHSLKGTGTTFGLPAVSELSHKLETVLDGLRSETFTTSPVIIDCLLRASDELRGLFNQAKKGNKSPQISSELMAELTALATGVSPVKVASTKPAAAEAERPVAAVENVSARESIRVKLEKLDRMVNLASELTLDKNARENLTKELVRVYSRFQRLHWRWIEMMDRFSVDTSNDPEVSEKFAPLTDEWRETLKSFDQDLGGCTANLGNHAERSSLTVHALQNEVLRIRMVPISLLFDNAPRLVRDLTRDGKKQVGLQIKGANTELDKRLLEQMSDPLIHLVRNAVDHGIESSHDRILAGKPARGTIELAAEQRGSQILISIRDDGHGIDHRRVLQKAAKMGIALPKRESEMTPEDTFPLIFLPGFSTKETVTEISGRGVGMDVVKRNIDGLKGEISIHSELGKGTTFQIFLPVSLAVIQAVLITAGGHDIYFATDSVVEIAELPESEFQPIDGKPTINRRNINVPVDSLAKVFGAPENRARGANRVVIFVQGIVRGRREVFGFFIDEALEEHSIVLKEPNRHFKGIPHMAGVTIRPDGSVTLVVDTTSLIAHALHRDSTPWSPTPAAAPQKRHKLLVCDDTHTSRELFRTLLEAAGHDVVMAKNGKEGFAIVEKGGIDLVVSDIQMPEMDGYELVAKVKGTARFKNTPVVLVSSLSKEEEKLRGLQAGANAYIVKGSFDQNNLISTVETLLG